MIHITGLTPKQRMLMDVMWQFDTMLQVEEFIRSLPKRDAEDAHSLVKIAQWESLEQEGALDDYTQDSLDVIGRIRSSL